MANFMAEPAPRLLSLEAAAIYLSVSTDTLQHWMTTGLIHAIRPTLPSGRRFGRVLVDRVELDDLIERSREPA
jgi:hypothetical protein